MAKITQELYYLGQSDRRLGLFENMYPIPRGISYNAYLIKDEKTALMDTVDHAVASAFFEDLTDALGGRALDYVIVSHMEPDHSATLGEVLRRYPNATLVMTQQARKMLSQFFPDAVSASIQTVGMGDKLVLGTHTLSFIPAPMVHWPEVMVSFDEKDGTLFSADAFGTFGALDGCLYADEMDFARDWLDDARRYYANIVGKFGMQTAKLLTAADGLPIQRICPLHGPIWRKDIGWFMDKYRHWAAFEPEEKAAVIIYGSIYGGTKRAAELLAASLADKGVSHLRVFDASNTHVSYLVAQAFRVSHIVLAAPTYNAEIFTPVQSLLTDLKEHGLCRRTFALIENGSWAPMSGAKMRAAIEGMKEMRIVGDTLSLRSTLSKEQLPKLNELAALLANELAPKQDEGEVDPAALYAISYGLYALVTRDGEKDNASIVNAVMQVTDKPRQIELAVNKQNLSHDTLLKTGVANLCVLSQSADFALFQRFGFQSGRDSDKFAGLAESRTNNGLRELTKDVCATISLKLVETRDLGSHTSFLCEITQAKRVSGSAPAMTYAYYHSSVKPQPPKQEEHKKGFVCTVCGYVYEGDTMPDDFVCPLCKHGVDAFKPIE